jgi:hypothetical protein
MDTLTNDIVPIGDFETIPVTITGNYLTYPGVIKIGGPYDTALLFDEYNNTFRSLENNFLTALKDILIDATPKEVKEHLVKLGWEGNDYISYSLRHFGTNILKDEVQHNTKVTLESFGDTFRQQYMCAAPKKRLKPHVDNINCEVHGFKIHIPINVNYHVFVKNTNNEKFDTYILEPGYAYYLNSCLPHFVANPYNKLRVNLSFQLASDKLIREGKVMQPTRQLQDESDENEIYAIL